MGLMWRLFAPRPLKKARRALHPSWVIEDAIVHSVRKGRRQRQRQAAPQRRAARPAPQRAQAHYEYGAELRDTDTGRTWRCPHDHRTEKSASRCADEMEDRISRLGWDEATRAWPQPGTTSLEKSVVVAGEAGSPVADPPPPDPQRGGDAPGDRPPPGYPPPSYPPGWRAPGYQPPAKRTGRAMTALVLGIAGIFTLLPAPFAVGFGISALARSRRQQARGKGMAVTGLVLGVVGSVILVIAVVAAAVSGPSGSKPASAARATATPAASESASHAVILTAAAQEFASDVHRTYLRSATTSSAVLAAIGQHVCSGRRAGDSQAAVVRYVGSQLRGAPASVARLAEKDLCPRYLPALPAPKITRPAPTTPPAVPESLCGAPANPYHLNLCGRGSLVYNPPPDVCSYFSCIPNFPNGTGYMVECNDGMYSMSGGRQGACSYHGGERMAVTQG